ncbi:YigZ family protein [Rhodococcus sp. SG20037]|uniref:IMPACT family protein n=1 Tax=Rhodococcus sp. SG20037 TaxID=3074148 RepID=UPI00287FDCF4|nr:YigZ family protein [Rhodococcus sp. SG20037]WNF40327.1 YigZ family protein [Rhodococcus sp. SG20037]
MPFTLVPGADHVVETEVKHSRFIAALHRVDDAEAATEFVAEQKSLYPDARHHCSAFVIGYEANSRVERAHDDGEPGGTAGVPMLQVLKSRDLVDVIVVVTRYFGGIKLGAGGLVRAYSGAVSVALDSAELVARERKVLRTLAIRHSEAGRVEAELRARGVSVLGTTYGSKAVMTLAAGDADDLDSIVASITSGAGQLEPAGSMWVDTTVRG